MWVICGIMSAILLGFYDVFKKESLKDNAVLPVLFINTLICSCLFIPLIGGSAAGLIPEESQAYVPPGDLHDHLLAASKAVIVLSSWICGYFAMKRLPLTVVGPVNATRPVITLVGAMLIFGEKLNILQWAGVIVAILSFWMLNRSGRKEGIDLRSNRWMMLLVLAAFLGAASGLYDKYLLSPDGQGMDRNFVQGWYYFYQMLLMAVIFMAMWFPDRARSTFSWRWTIPLISLTLTAADMVYMYALTIPGAMIAVLSMIRRSSVLVSFLFGAFLLHEKNIRSKATDLVLVMISLILLVLGSL